MNNNLCLLLIRMYKIMVNRNMHDYQLESVYYTNFYAFLAILKVAMWLCGARSNLWMLSATFIHFSE